MERHHRDRCPLGAGVLRGRRADLGEELGDALPPHGRRSVLTGTWQVRHRKLRSRLTGCTDWDEYESRFEARTHFNGLVSIDEGEFVAGDRHEGVPILCRFRWTVHGPERASWDQAFSIDDGSTWETNWVMEQTRLE